jgi:hypothetical protein
LERRAQLHQREIWLLSEQGTHLLMMRWQNFRLPAGAGMTMADLTSLAPLLEQFLHHPQGDSEPPGNGVPRSFLLIVRGENARSQIQR